MGEVGLSFIRSSTEKMRHPQTGRYTGFKHFNSMSRCEEFINTAMMTPIKLAPVFSALSVVKIGSFAFSGPN